MKSIKDTLDLFSPKGVPHEVGNREVMFYPLSTSMAFRLKSIASPLFSAITTLFTVHKNDVTVVTDDLMDRSDPDGKRVEASKTTISAIDPEMAKMRAMERDRAVGTLVDSLADERNQIVICMTIMDSMRDDFKRPVNHDDAIEFLKSDNVTIDVLIELMKGVAKANAKVFGPLGERFRETIGTSIQGMENSLRAKVEKMAEEKAAELDSTPG